MLTNTTKITSKGQVTLPKEVRDFLHTDIVTFEISGDSILIRPINSVEGSLKKYKKNISFKEAREKAWNEVASDYQA